MQMKNILMVHLQNTVIVVVVNAVNFLLPVVLEVVQL